MFATSTFLIYIVTTKVDAVKRLHKPLVDNSIIGK